MRNMIGVRQSGQSPTWWESIGASHPRRIREVPRDPGAAAGPGVCRASGVGLVGRRGRGLPLLSPISFVRGIAVPVAGATPNSGLVLQRSGVD